MKKFAFAALAVSAVVAAPLALAQNPTNILINVVCPSTQTPTNVITNFGNYIAGYGTEQIDQNPMVQPYFVGQTATDTPPRLNGFNSSGVNYDSTTGQVDCSYTQSGFTDLVVSYVLTNGRGGAVQNSNQNSLIIAMPVGLK